MSVRLLRPRTVTRMLAAGLLALPLAAAHSAFAQKIEAEDAETIVGCEVFAHAGASGGFRVRNFDVEGDRIVFNNVADAHLFRVAYALDRPGWRQCSLYRDGVDVGTLRFPPSEDWNAYRQLAWEIDLGGTVELRLDADDIAANHGDTSVAFDFVEFLPRGTETSVVQRDALDRLVYQPYEDQYGDHFPIDYAACGWGFGAERLPERAWCPVKATVSPPGAGVDAGPLIQAAIDAVSAMPLNAYGFRGAVLLEPGEFEVPGTLSINASGVVLRGSGPEGPNQTILTGTGTGQRTLLTIAGGGFFSEVGGTSQTIVDDYVPSGSLRVNVADSSGFSAGDPVIVYRNSPQAWIDEIGMDDIPSWTPGSRDSRFDRRVVWAGDGAVLLDAPTGNSIDADLDGGRIYKYNYGSVGRIRNSGVEDLLARSSFTSPTDEDHCWNFVAFDDIEHGFARNILAQHFGFGVVRLLTGAKYVTAEDVASRDMVSIVTGGRRYPFVLERGQLCLFRRCYSDGGRHDFVSQSVVPGPNAFQYCMANGALNDSGPHQRWTTATLFDNVQVHGDEINFRDRGTSGTGHGWAGANQMAWNARADSYIIERPPTAQNWNIGGLGGGTSGDGFIESGGTNVGPQSLRAAQVADRLRRETPGDLYYDSLTDVIFPTVNVAPQKIVTLQAAFSVDALSGAPAAVRIESTAGTEFIEAAFSPDPGLPFLLVSVVNGSGSAFLECPDGVDEFLGAGGYEAVVQFEFRDNGSELKYWIYRTDVGALVSRGRARSTFTMSAALDTYAERSAASVSELRTLVHTARIITAPAAGDALVDEANPSTNFGTGTELALRRGVGGPAAEANLSFFLPEIEDEVVVGYRLRLQSTGLEGGLKLYDVAPRPWAETTVTWNTRMQPAGALDRTGPVLAGEEIVLDASAATVSGGRMLLMLRNDRQQLGMGLAARESGADGPILEVIAPDFGGSASGWRMVGPE